MLNNSSFEFKKKFMQEFTSELILNYKKDLPVEPTENKIIKKIEEIINNPEIIAIECPGPDRYFIIKKLKGISVINLALSEEKIEELIKKFAENSREKIDDIIFKLSFNGIKISGIFSRQAGSRFLIQK